MDNEINMTVNDPEEFSVCLQNWIYYIGVKFRATGKCIGVKMQEKKKIVSSSAIRYR